MGTSISLAVAIFLILCLLQKECRAESCYQCDSRTDIGCSASNVDPAYLKSCPPAYPFCRKAVYMHHFTGRREESIVRECSKWRTPVCYRGRYPADSYQLICECRGPGCNRSPGSWLGPGFLLCCTVCQLIVFLSPTWLAWPLVHPQHRTVHSDTQ